MYLQDVQLKHRLFQSYARELIFLINFLKTRISSHNKSAFYEKAPFLPFIDVLMSYKSFDVLKNLPFSSKQVGRIIQHPKCKQVSMKAELM